MRSLLTSVIVIASVGAAAQESRAPLLALAPTSGAWVVEITTAGGFTGRGRGSLAVASEGTTRCISPATCPARTAADTIATMTGLLAGLRTAAWDITSAQDTCRDCVQTTMTVRTRQANGAERTSVFRWNNVTFGSAPEDVKRLYSAVAQIR